MRMPPRSLGRMAFTLIELLVVIAIIGILVALTATGVIPIFKKGPEVRNVSDIRQLATAVEAFKAEFKMFPPSRIILKARASDYTGTQEDRDSLALLNRLFPRLGNFAIDWRGTNSIGTYPANGYLLEGDQCLVFFLGGPGGNKGFSTQPSNPLDYSVNGRKGPYFQGFNRLTNRNASPFPSFLDSYGTDKPFVYFSSGARDNGYNTPVANPSAPGGHVIPGLGNVQPYTESPGKYHRPKGFQIISAGADGLFSTNYQWTPANAGAIGAAGADDQTNFHDAKMGVAGN